MDDSQSPPNGENRADNRKGDAVRRGSMRLRDAEDVATTRRDMFGDGSLLDALAGRPMRGEGVGEPPDGDAESGGDEPAKADHVPLADMAVQASDGADPGPASEPAESLDEIIDSFPAEEHGQVQAEAPERYQLSAIFEGLGAQPPNGENGAPPEHPDGDGSSPEDGEAPGANQQAAQAPGFGAPPYFEPLATALEPPDWPPAAAPTAEGASASDTETSGTGTLAADGSGAGTPDTGASGTGEPRGPSSELAPFPEPADWPSQQADPSEGHPAGVEPAHEGDAELSPEPFAWPPFPEPPGSEAANADAPPLEPPALVRGISEPADDAGAAPFPAPHAWPPFPELPGSETRLTAPETAGLPPYIELPAYPDSDDQAQTPVPEAFGEEPPPPGAAPPFSPPPFPSPRGVPGFADRPAATVRPEQGERDAPQAGLETAARAKIAAEANATAEALDNLQRLLNKTISSATTQPPQSQPAYPQAQPYRDHHAPLHLPQNDPFAHELAPPMLPLPVPPSERGGSKNVYLLGFLTGLVLSVMAGAALYFLINAG